VPKRSFFLLGIHRFRDFSRRGPPTWNPEKQSLGLNRRKAAAGDFRDFPVRVGTLSYFCRPYSEERFFPTSPFRPPHSTVTWEYPRENVIPEFRNGDDDGTTSGASVAS